MALFFAAFPLWVAQGEVVEQGSHTTLSEKTGGAYYTLLNKARSAPSRQISSPPRHSLLPPDALLLAVLCSELCEWPPVCSPTTSPARPSPRVDRSLSSPAGPALTWQGQPRVRALSGSPHSTPFVFSSPCPLNEMSCVCF